MFRSYLNKFCESEQIYTVGAFKQQPHACHFRVHWLVKRMAHAQIMR